jgi:hypothetical protein
MKTDAIRTKNVVLTALSAWVLTLATLVASVHVVRQQVVVSTMRPAFAYADEGESLYNRNDNEDETVHMPTEFDIGLRIAAISGKK